MKALLKRFFFPLCLALIVVAVCIATYKPGTFLSGWDTLHPEFDFGLNFERMIQGVWRDNQGLGAVAGHSHMADLPRVLFLWIAHFLFPLESLRYLYVFLCLLLGPLGVYFLVRELVPRKGAEIVGFLGGLFYLCNLSTVQQFYAPFEMFTTQYAYLPWIILYSLRVLKKPVRKNLLLFSALTLLAAPQAYAAHLWYPFFATYILFIGAYSLLHRGTVKKGLLLIALTLALNSFWLLPNLYFIQSTGSVPKESKQNRIYSQEYRLRNREHGYLKDVALMRGFYFSWSSYNPQRAYFEYLMPEWKAHIANPFVAAIGYLLFAGAVCGIGLSIKRRDPLTLPFLPFFVLPFVFLMNHTFPFDFIFDSLLRVSLFEEALRFVFTKFSVLLLFSLALYLAYTLSAVYQKLREGQQLITTVLITILLLIYVFPLFRGSLISDRFKVKIPTYYFDFWAYMKDRDNGTVLALPLQTSSAWQYYTFGYQGSGFIWFGLKQPILDRDFDRWSIPNEQAFREFQYAVYAQNKDLFVRTLQKYSVRYLLYDAANITPELKNRDQVLYAREINRLLASLVKEGSLKKDRRFGSVSLYTVVSPHRFQEIESLPSVSPAYRWDFEDAAFQMLGDYYSREGENSYVFPFRDLVTPSDRVRKSLVPTLFSNKESVSSVAVPRLDASALQQYIGTAKGVSLDGNAIRFSSTDTQAGLAVKLDSLPHNTGYLVTFTSQNLEGLPLRICLKNLYSGICVLYDELSKNNGKKAQDSFIIPAYENGVGYTLTVNNISFGNYATENRLYSITMYPFPYQFLASLYGKPSGESFKKNIAILPKSYHQGWTAYQGGKQLKDHVPVNNWANGWITDDPDSPVSYIFWPQYLEYAGFGLIVLGFVWIGVRRRND